MKIWESTPLQAQRPQEENSQICLWRGKRSTESQPSTFCVGSTPQNQLCYVKQRKKQGKEGRLSFFWWEECYDPLQAHSVFTAKSALQRTPGVSGLGSLLFGDFFFFLKQNNYLVLGLLSKCHLRGQSPERSPCLKKRHRPGKQHLPVDTLQEPAVLPGHQGWATPRSLLRQWYNPNCIISVVFVHQPVVIWYCKSVSTNMESRNF